MTQFVNIVKSTKVQVGAGALLDVDDVTCFAPCTYVHSQFSHLTNKSSSTETTTFMFMHHVFVSVKLITSHPHHTTPRRVSNVGVEQRSIKPN